MARRSVPPLSKVKLLPVVPARMILSAADWLSAGQAGLIDTSSSAPSRDGVMSSSQLPLAGVDVGGYKTTVMAPSPWIRPEETTAITKDPVHSGGVSFDTVGGLAISAGDISPIAGWSTVF